jgi:hypothetical protein
MHDDLIEALSLGAGVQSTRLFLGSCLGELPRLKAGVFADTLYEPKAVYKHLAWLEDYGKKAGIPIFRVSVGDLRRDALEFRQYRKTCDGKRHASIPVFVKNPDGSRGRVRRQCTSAYKIEPIEGFVLKALLGVKPRGKRPSSPRVRLWMGISSDESRRANFPGLYRVGRKGRCKEWVVRDLDGNETLVRPKEWVPDNWKVHGFPLLGEVRTPERKVLPFAPALPAETRQDCKDWLAAHFPGRSFPRSACICCPFRSNEEWRRMRDEEPDEFADAVAFDHAMRIAHRRGVESKKIQVGEPYLHSQLVPLDMADLDGAGHRGQGGCGTLFDGLDGMCDV